MDEKNNTVHDEKHTLLDIDLQSDEMRRAFFPQHYDFSRGDIRHLFDDFFDISATYTFLRSIANPEAVQLVRKHSDKLTREVYGKDSEVSVEFDHGMKEKYHGVIEKLSKRNKIHQVRYPLVNNHETYHFNYTMVMYWPQIHVVKGDGSSIAKFKSFFGQLNSDEAFQILKESEGPQNYRLCAMELLKKEGVLPLTLEDRVWSLPGKELKNAIDFLCTFELKREPERHYSPDDD
jgi:hypothetical protein